MKPSSDNPRPGNGQNLIIVVLAIGILAMGAWVLQMQREIRAVSDVPKIPVKVVAPVPRTAPAADAADVTVVKTDLPPAARAEGEEKAPVNPMAAMAAQMSDMMKMPAMRDMMAAEQKRAIEMQYRDLFDELKLTPEQRSRLIGLMVDGQGDSMETAMKMMSGQLTDADREEMEKQMTAAQEAAEKKLGEFFAVEFPGEPAKWDAYQKYTEELPHRMEVNAMQESFTRAGQPMTPEQSAAMLRIFAEQAKSEEPPGGDVTAVDMTAGSVAVGSGAKSGETPMSMAGFGLSPEIMEQAMQEQEASQKKILERAATVLTPAQLAIFRESQDAQTQMMKMGMEFSRQMTTGAPAK